MATRVVLDGIRALSGGGFVRANGLRQIGPLRRVLGCTIPCLNVPIEGHVSGRGKVKHREFAMASVEMSEDEFTTFLATVFRNQAA